MHECRFAPVALLLSFVCVGGCATSGARFVDRAPDGGTVAIPNNSNIWPTFYRDQAEQSIAKVSPQGYAIDYEEEMTVRPAWGDRTKRYDYDGALVELDPERKEYHIHYVVKPPAGAGATLPGDGGGAMGEKKSGAEEVAPPPRPLVP